jgi:hypothetical protein
MIAIKSIRHHFTTQLQPFPQLAMEISREQTSMRDLFAYSTSF